MGIVINITDKGVSLVYDQNKMSKESYRELNIILDKLILFSQTQKIS
jgi:hypothetical protein